jgi:hypothetical protein
MCSYIIDTSGSQGTMEWHLGRLFSEIEELHGFVKDNNGLHNNDNCICGVGVAYRLQLLFG